MILSILLSRGYVKTIRCQNTFLQGELHGLAFMKQSLGYISNRYPNHVCKLNKAIYGLEQTHRSWYACLSEFLVHIGFINNYVDASLFVCNKFGYNI